MSTSTPTVPGGHSKLERPFGARLPDRLVRWGLTALAVLVLLLVIGFFAKLYQQSQPALAQFGVFDFVTGTNWSPVDSIYGVGWLVVGTLITAAIALLIGVPIAVAAALFVTEVCPRKLRMPLTIMIELLAAVPSVVYGLWGVFVLIPKLKPAEEWFSGVFGFIPFLGGDVPGPNYFIAGLLLAIMIVPIVCAISREVLSTVPQEQKEAALGLGATRTEMIRLAVLPHSRAGITGAAMLGVGRAMGETIAVTLVIGNASGLTTDIFGQGNTLASIIANQFGEAASNKLQLASLVGAGLVLFLLTLLINGAARGFVVRAERRQNSTPKNAGGVA